LLSALLLLPLTAGALRLFGFRRVYAALDRALHAVRPPLMRDSGAERLRARATSSLVQRAAGRSPVPVRCLPIAIVVWALLRMERLPAALHLGVRTSEHRFEAHAWVACGSTVLNDSPGAWCPLPPLPSAASTGLHR
jgi:hypothetical protein